METKIAFDTNTLIYLITNQDLKKQKIMENLWEKYSNKLIPYQVFQEFGNVLLKKRKLPVEKIEEILELLMDEVYIPSPDDKTILLALKLKKEYNLQYWDSFVLAETLTNDCDILFTENFYKISFKFTKPKIINPFK